MTSPSAAAAATAEEVVHRIVFGERKNKKRPRPTIVGDSSANEFSHYHNDNHDYTTNYNDSRSSRSRATRDNVALSKILLWEMARDVDDIFREMVFFKKKDGGSSDSIDDNYPKYVLSMDKFDFSRDGIKHVNVIDYLLERD